MSDDKEKGVGPTPGEKGPVQGRKIRIPVNMGKPPIDVQAQIVQVPPPEKAPDSLPKEVVERINKAINRELAGVLPKCHHITMVLWPVKLDDGKEVTRTFMMSTYTSPQDNRQVLEAMLKKLEGLTLGQL